MGLPGTCSFAMLSRVGASTLLLISGAAPGRAMGFQSPLELLLPGDVYQDVELPADAAGRWWVLHATGETFVLDERDVAVAAVQGCGDGPAGRAVSVPGIADPVMLVRRHPDLRAGAVETAFVAPAGDPDARAVATMWRHRPLTVSWTIEPAAGDEPGSYRINATLEDRGDGAAAVAAPRLLLDRSFPWQGDGDVGTRWIGDLNRDGWPDLLVDASYKYSVYTTRLFLSAVAEGSVALIEAAVLERAAC